jgi:8-oxo-dGTP diphosphatase
VTRLVLPLPAAPGRARCRRAGSLTGLHSSRRTQYPPRVDAPANDESSGCAADLAELSRRVTGWRPDLVGTLMFLIDDGRVLLIRKLRGHGAGRINGPGGKPEPGETPLQCVLRETEEEVGVRPRRIRLAAVLRFIDIRADDWLGYIYLAEGCVGEPRESAEAVPVWYPIGRLPFDEMWDDDRYWLPRVLAGERVTGDFLFSGGRLRAHRLSTVDELEDA